MTPTLVHTDRTERTERTDARVRARDWAEIQERMLVPLYEAVYERLGVGAGTRLLGLGCGSGLALLLAASRGATVTGVEPDAPEQLALARERLSPGPEPASRGPAARLLGQTPDRAEEAATAASRPAYNLVTAFQPIGRAAGDGAGLVALLERAVPLAEHRAPVVLTGWGPPERCATASVLRAAARLADPSPATAGRRPAPRDGLEGVARRAGLRAARQGHVACPFGYADAGSAVRGLLSTGLCDAAIEATDPERVAKELTEALRPHLRRDGTVWMANAFRYLIAHTRPFTRPS
ncbi:SAM-dependent methyltransferase [Streptomyces sp. O3]